MPMKNKRTVLIDVDLHQMLKFVHARTGEKLVAMVEDALWRYIHTRYEDEPVVKRAIDDFRSEQESQQGTNERADGSADARASAPAHH